MTTTIWADSALLENGWENSVEFTIDNNGYIQSVEIDKAYEQGDKAGVVIAGMPNIHSHAHQRAMAGLGEKAGLSGDAAKDSFWTWRKVMYHYLERIQPEDLYHISAQLYLEMLKAGYTCVGEFQYLHHQIDGCPYQDRSEMTQRCLNAANDVGLGFTALPVLYRFGGFGSADPVDGQKRFINDAEGFVEIVNALQKSCSGNHNASVGIAPHSLRAIDKPLLSRVLDSLGMDNLAAVHIHIAEQTKEVR